MRRFFVLSSRITHEAHMRATRLRTGTATFVIFCFTLVSQGCAQRSTVEDARPTPPFDAAERLTAPVYSFFVLGDYGSGGKGQKAVAAAMAGKRSRDGGDAVFGVGDNFLNTGVESVNDPQWRSKFEDVYTSDDFPVPFYMILGNHDYELNTEAQLQYTGLRLPDGAVTRWTLPAHFWTTVLTPDGASFRIRLIGLDTEPLTGGDAAARKRQIAWLDSVLASSREEWILVLGHHPVYSNGSDHGNTIGMIKHVKPLLERHHVDAYFAGHDHSLQVLAPENGVHYFVSGGGSKSDNVRWSDNTVFAATNLGFLWCQINAGHLLVQVLDAEGNVLFAKALPRNAKQ
jgi:tartrate-resistant acid phosphatase type 5